MLSNDKVGAAAADCLKFIMIIIVRCALIAATATEEGGTEREAEQEQQQ